MKFMRKPLQLCCLLLLGAELVQPCTAQDTFARQAGEYFISGQLGGDQTLPDVSINSSGGLIVWQDNAIDGIGTGIGAQRLNSNLSGEANPFRVNQQAASNQEKPQVKMLPGGGAVFVWQSGEPGNQDIYARLMDSNGTFSTGDLLVNQYTTEFQICPKVDVMPDGSAVIVWASSEQDGHLQAVYGRVIDGNGTFAGDEFRLNQTTHLNQRTPDVTVLDNGGFVAVWISEKFTGADPRGGGKFLIDVIGRIFDAAGNPLSDEIVLDDTSNVCANPAVTATAVGFFAAWGQRDLIDRGASWDVYTAGFDSAGARVAAPIRANDHNFGDQYAPKIARGGASVFLVWSSMGQDGSYEGVYGKVFAANGLPFSGELQANSTTDGRQQFPDVEADDNGRFLVTWSSYSFGSDTRMDVTAQRFASTDPLPVLAAPHVSPLSQTRISASWVPLAGYNVQQYEVYVDGNVSPILTTNNYVTITGLVPGTSHSVKMTFLLVDGRRGALSASRTVATWGEDSNFDGLPDDWQSVYWSGTPTSYPAVYLDSDGDGASNVDEFLAGTDPTDSNSVLKLTITREGNSLWLNWNSMRGQLYEVQVSTDMKIWSSVGPTRFAVDVMDSTLIGNYSTALYRVIRVR
jgi:hypothetical protein